MRSSVRICLEKYRLFIKGDTGFYHFPILFQQGKLNQAKSQLPRSPNNRSPYGSNLRKQKTSNQIWTRLEKAKICRWSERYVKLEKRVEGSWTGDGRSKAERVKWLMRDSDLDMR